MSTCNDCRREQGNGPGLCGKHIVFGQPIDTEQEIECLRLAYARVTAPASATDVDRLAAVLATIVSVRDVISSVMYENGTYHQIKYDIDGAQDMLFQALMNIEQALAAVRAAAERSR